MFITITNAAPKHKGQKTAISVDTIVSIWRTDVEREDGSKDTVTFIYMPPHGTWEAEETLEEITALINDK
jgi:hypothetical protein